MSWLSQIIIFLVAAVIAVPIFSRLGLGSILGYLVAGILIGPFGFGFIKQVEDILHFSELGVVFLLFIIGLELKPSRLWLLRKSIFGMGLVQVLVSAVAISLIAFAFGLTTNQAIIVGLILALSSTAIGLQMLSEKRQMTSQHGRAAFAILIFQDIAVIPLLTIIPLLSPHDTGASNQAVWQSIGMAIGIIVAIVFLGRFLLKPAFRLITSSKLPEISSAAALLLVIGMALIMEQFGLSMALGAFLAGVLLAESEYRHELEANIQPFKGLLMGLFFIAVGMSVDLSLLNSSAASIILLTIILLTVKFSILITIALLSRHSFSTALQLAGTIAQSGEFGFVLFAIVSQQQMLPAELVSSLIMVITLSMGATPLMFLVCEKIANSIKNTTDSKPFDTIEEDDEPKVIIAGFGRFGQIIARVLSAKKIPFTALEIDSEQVDFVRKFGNKVYYGDALRLDLLRAAHAEKAKIIILAISNIEASIAAAKLIKSNFPNLEIFARARNRQHATELLNIGVKYTIRETLLSSLEMANQLLQHIGFSELDAKYITNVFQKHDEELLEVQRSITSNEKEYIEMARKSRQELEQLFEKDLSVKNEDSK